MLILFIFVPIIKAIASIMGRIRHKRALITDVRIETQQSMLNGIKVTKLNNYEGKYKQWIDASRLEELKLLRRELFVWAMTLVFTVCSPLLAAAATFVTHVLVDESHILTPAKSFTVLLLFAALRFPINYVGRLIGKLGQALEATKRIDSFLSRGTSGDEIAGAPENVEKGSILLQSEEASFGVGAVTASAIDDVEKVSQHSFHLSGSDCGPSRFWKVQLDQWNHWRSCAGYWITDNAYGENVVCQPDSFYS
jgi:ABC-type multidrug transport system fused ATPase/permease subunit